MILNVVNARLLLNQKITRRILPSTTYMILYWAAIMPNTDEATSISVSLRALILVKICNIISNSLDPRRASKPQKIHTVIAF